jgi:hypothetical protein
MRRRYSPNEGELFGSEKEAQEILRERQSSNDDDRRLDTRASEDRETSTVRAFLR